jgi:hypothetical protein
MKKLLIVLIIIVLGFVVALELITSAIDEPISKDNLSSIVYQDPDSFDGAQDALEGFFNFGNQDDYTGLELFMNYMIFDSIKENINASYDPLSDCETDACKYIYTMDQGRIEYAYAKLNDDNQMVLTISFVRDSYPSVETAIHLIFDISVENFGTSFTLTLDEARLADRPISKENLDRIFNLLDKDSIEDSITYGELNLDDYTFTVTLININLF